MDSSEIYVLICTECQNAFPPHHFRGQCEEFRMCTQCKLNNPEIVNYLEKYIYQPQRAKIWKPFQRRLEKVSLKCDMLEAELSEFKSQYCNPSNPNSDEDNAETRAKSEEFINNLIEKCLCVEEELMACKLKQAETVMLQNAGNAPR